MNDVLESRWYSLQNEIHGFFAVLPLKWQRPRQHLKLGEKTQKNVIGILIYVIFTLSQYVFFLLTISTPNDHQSALWVCPCLFTTSGAMYSTVPQKE